MDSKYNQLESDIPLHKSIIATALIKIVRIVPHLVYGRKKRSNQSEQCDSGCRTNFQMGVVYLLYKMITIARPSCTVVALPLSTSYIGYVYHSAYLHFPDEVLPFCTIRECAATYDR